MKKSILLITASLSLLFISCKKNTPENINEPVPAGTAIAAGSFLSNAHSCSGTVKIIKDSANKIQLVFTNFATDNGPDLRVWISPNDGGSPYQELGLLKAVTGNFSYELNASHNYLTNNHVLIWCKRYSVLFGHAVLQ